MAGPVALRLERRLGERQQRAGGEDRLTPNDDGAVMEGGPGREHRIEQVDREVAVDHHARFGDLLQPGLALQHDERPVVLGCKARRGARDHGAHALGGPLIGRR